MTFDFDRPIDQMTALRINLRGYNGSGADGDRVNFGRFGIAPSIVFGIGTDMQLTVGSSTAFCSNASS